ncbi:hypothetical protein CBF23_007520 [Marinomonas agarivorans]|nr:hypothetical protein CBF23_007520 [Marinomonas agarivorans]
MIALDKSPKKLLILLTFLISLASNCATLSAEEITRENLSEQLLSISESLYEIANHNDSELDQIATELGNAESLLNDQNTNIDDLINQTTSLQEKIVLMRNKQAEVDEKFAEINRNYEKYVFQTRAKAIVPFLYAAIGFSMADSGDKFVYTLAGYGTGALVENTGYGLASGITWLTYSFDF